jgi:dCMP deaminase
MHAEERDRLLLNIASLMATRSTCLRGHTGAVIARSGRIIATGFNGAPPGQPHCVDVGCGGGVKDESNWNKASGDPPVTFPHGCTRAVHAEANAVALCARYGTPCDSATMYCTHSPCTACSQLMGSSGIVRVVFGELYRITEPIEMLRKLGMEVVQVG